MKINSIVLSVSCAVVVAMPCCAAVELLSPANGEVVALVPEAQKKVLALPTLVERLALFAYDREHGKVLRHDKLWRKSQPLVLRWCANDGEIGPWKVEIGKLPDLSDARVWYVPVAKADAVSGRNDAKPVGEVRDGDVEYAVPQANLEIDRKYFWRVTAHRCKAKKVKATSPVAMFKTEDVAPRWIAVDGRVYNIRDLGGWHATGGRRVRQGMIYRGQGLNENSVTGERQGKNRLTVEDVKYLTGTLGIRTDLDLRSKGETADLSESPLGQSVSLVLRSSHAYEGIFKSQGKKVMAENFRVFCKRENYPVYMHCIAGADRTGSLAYMLLGALGVDRHDMEVDWESTFYPNIPDASPNPKAWCREAHFNNGLSKYGKDGDSWNRRVELYLLDCGVTEGEIAVFRSIMLEP